MKWSNSALALIMALILGTTGSVMSVPALASTISDSADVAPQTAGNGGVSFNLPGHFSESQVNLLIMAYEIAKADGHKDPRLFQGLLLQETNAGKITHRKNSTCYGIFQIKVIAAREVLQRYPSLWDEFNFRGKSDKEIISKLKHNERFNATIASRYGLVLKRLGYDTIEKLALAFNLGPTGAKSKNPRNNRYVRSVMKNIKSLES